MTATIKPPRRGGRAHRRVPRFSSLESLGFSDSEQVWSDSPLPDPLFARGTQVIQPVPPSEVLADWEPTEVDSSLTGRHFRWSLLVTTVFLVGAVAGLGWWLYQRPIAEAEATATAVALEAERLEASLPGLETFSRGLLVSDENTDTTPLAEVDDAARDLFNTSGELTASDGTARSDAAAASSAALEAVRLAADAYSYSMAVRPMVVAPELETDPEAIALDDAARAFGDWQHEFDDIRAALPGNILADVTSQFDAISEDLPALLTRYVDALRGDSQEEAAAVIGGLAGRLSETEELLERALAGVQARVDLRIEAVRGSLSDIGD